jgi:type IV pilus assembly protein PilV
MSLRPCPAGGLPANPKASGGFTLIEVLVSSLILGLGLLGLAGLQTASLRNTQSASQRSETAFLAYEMADRLRSNPQGVQNGNYNNQPKTGDQCLNAICTPDQKAGYDLALWAADLEARLPNGAGVVCIDSTPDDGTPPPGDPLCDNQGSVYAIKIWWRDWQQDAQAGDTKDYQRFVTSLTP